MPALASNIGNPMVSGICPAKNQRVRNEVSAAPSLIALEVWQCFLVWIWHVLTHCQLHHRKQIGANQLRSIQIE
eukprot:6014136-Amphidinium_carterae.2